MINVPHILSCFVRTDSNFNNSKIHDVSSFDFVDTALAASLLLFVHVGGSLTRSPLFGFAVHVDNVLQQVVEAAELGASLRRVILRYLRQHAAALDAKLVQLSGRGERGGLFSNDVLLQLNTTNKTTQNQAGSISIA